MTTVGMETVNLSGRPVVITDVDDVVLKFIEPFQSFLGAQALRVIPRSFRLNGNIVEVESGIPIEDTKVRGLLETFFNEQLRWQTPFEGAVATLNSLAEVADIVFLTSMPPAYATTRRELLSSVGLSFPLVATLEKKGPVAAGILAEGTQKTVFLDDMAHNVLSVGEHLPECLLLHMPPDSEVHSMAPSAGAAALKVSNWQEAHAHIDRHLSTLSGGGT